MSLSSRRQFLGATVAGLATTSSILAADVSPKVLSSAEDYVFQPSTLFLTWQRDPTTTMTVQWIGVRGETEDTKVYYSTSRSGPWLTEPTAMRPYPLSDLKLYRAELSSLKPGADYYFRIGKQSPTYRFRTMPAKATDTITFISGGDSGANDHAIANNIQAARQDPMFAVVGGDLAYENGRSVAASLAYLRNYSKHMVGRDGNLIPMVACIGNHEVDGGYAKPRAKAPFFYALFDGLFDESSYATLDFGEYLSLVLLDSGHTSAIGGEQAAWLDKTLKARQHHPHVLAVNHVPAYPSYREPEAVPEKPSILDSFKADPSEGKLKTKLGTGEGNRKHWVPLFEKYRVPVVLEHHDHTFKRTKPLLDGLANDNGVLYLGDGSWGRIRSPQKPEKRPYLAVASRDYHLSLHRIQGEERFHVALDEFGRVMDVCHSGQRRSGVVRVSHESVTK
jgi:acid phosphatase type 7